MPRVHRRKAAILTLHPLGVAAPVAAVRDHQQRLQAARLRPVENCFAALVDLYDTLFPASERTSRESPDKSAVLMALRKTFRARQARHQRAYEQATRDTPHKTVH